jgi:Bacterial PH domain
MADQAVVFRIPLFTRIVTVLPPFAFAVFWVTLVLFVRRPHAARPLPDIWYATPFLWTALAAVLLVLVCYRRTTAMPDALYVRRFRLRRIPWSEIEGISPGIRFNNESLVVRLRDGGKVRLPAPVGDQWFGSHDRFLDRAVLLIDCWESYRG